MVSLATAYAIAQKPAIARAVPVTAVVMALFFNVTVLHVKRHPFATDPQYALARAWALTDREVNFPREDQGAWVVASPDTSARLLGCSEDSRLRRDRPAWADAPLSSVAPWTRDP